MFKQEIKLSIESFFDISYSGEAFNKCLSVHQGIIFYHESK